MAYEILLPLIDDPKTGPRINMLEVAQQLADLPKDVVVKVIASCLGILELKLEEGDGWGRTARVAGNLAVHEVILRGVYSVQIRLSEVPIKR